MSLLPRPAEADLSECRVTGSRYETWPAPPVHRSSRETDASPASALLVTDRRIIVRSFLMKKFLDFNIIILLFLFNKHCPIIE